MRRADRERPILLCRAVVEYASSDATNPLLDQDGGAKATTQLAENKTKLQREDAGGWTYNAVSYREYDLLTSALLVRGENTI